MLDDSAELVIDVIGESILLALLPPFCKAKTLYDMSSKIIPVGFVPDASPHHFSSYQIGFGRT